MSDDDEDDVEPMDEDEERAVRVWTVFGLDYLMLDYPRFCTSVLAANGNVDGPLQQLINKDNRYRNNYDPPYPALEDLPNFSCKPTGIIPSSTTYSKEFLGAMAYEICTNYSFVSSSRLPGYKINWDEVRFRMKERGFTDVKQGRNLNDKYKSMIEPPREDFTTRHISRENYMAMKTLYMKIDEFLRAGHQPDMDLVKDWKPPPPPPPPPQG